MKESIGQIIKRLRKKEGFTQEEFAVLLGVTSQAVSKWENNTGMPDISLIVPIAHVFGVSTDVLFGINGTSDSEAVSKIIKNAHAMLSQPLTATCILKKYRALQEGLKLYPNNTRLLLESMEMGLALSYPENKELYDADHAQSIYRECVRYAKLIISCSNQVSEIMRARMIMVILHSAYGDFAEALSHAEQFPPRADFNIHVMYAYYAHWKKDYLNESRSCQYGVLHYLEGMLNTTTRMAKSYMKQEKFQEAAVTLETSLDFIRCIFRDDEVMPPIHHREQGDLYMLLAEIYLRDKNEGRALQYLEKMVAYDLFEYEMIDGKMETRSPLLNMIPHGLYRKRIDRYCNLWGKLTDPCFNSLKENAQYRELIKKTSEYFEHN